MQGYFRIKVKITGEEVIVKHVHNHACIVPVPGPELVFAQSNDAMIISIHINFTMELYAQDDLRMELLKLAALHKISYEIAYLDLISVARKV